MPQMSRREMLQTTGAGAAVLALGSWNHVFAQAKGHYTLPELPYKHDALEPIISKRIMELHHDKHHQAYVDNLNKALAGHADLAKKPIDELMRDFMKVPETIRTAVINNGGGHANHSLFWEVMAPKGKGGKPEGALLKAIDGDLGSVEKLQSVMSEKGLTQFGSGWSWLVVEKGKLAVESTPNQITPLMQGKTPILGLDVWEHAYYLQYENRRGEYIKAWWDVVNWPAVAAKYAKAVKS